MPSTYSLYLFRHAKSDWDSPYRTDHDRTLARRGINAAQTMGRLLNQSGQMPTNVYCSTAQRAKQTLELAQSAGDWQNKTSYSDDLYAASATSTMQFLKRLPDDQQSVMLVGHEPTWSDLSQRLIGGGDIRFPTAAIAKINLHINGWSQLSAGCGELQWLLIPKLFS